MARLSKSVLGGGHGVLWPGYDLEKAEIGVVHLGVGAFHRAHQAAYFDSLLSLDSSWAIAGVSMRSASVQEKLAPQDGLYILGEMDESPTYRVIGSIRELFLATRQLDDLMARLVHPSTKLVTLTVTEFGYCLGPGRHLDTTLPVVQHDVLKPQAPKSAPGVIVEALRQRRSLGLPPFTILSCDNLPDNGQALRQAVIGLAAESDKDLASWIENEVPFPSSMVDSITPATTDAFRAQVQQATGLHDAWPIQRERFTQWVIEPNFVVQPRLDEVGVIFTPDVAAYEQAKLRLLNGSHSALAYIGLVLGKETVASAVADPELYRFIEHVLLREILPVLELPQGFDGEAYVKSLLVRYGNPAIRHELAQIAWDGSQKLPIRILPTITDNLAAGKPCFGLISAIAAWVHFVAYNSKQGKAFKDPMQDQLAALAQKSLLGEKLDLERFVREIGIFPDELSQSDAFLTALSKQYVRLSELSGASTHNVNSLLEAA